MEASGHLVEQFEAAFQNCLSAITSHEHFNVSESDEVKSSVEQNISKYLSIGRQLEAFFLEKRQLLAYHKPEDILKEDIAELKTELKQKEILIAKHQDKLQVWQTMLNRPHQGVQQAQGQAGANLQTVGTAGVQRMVVAHGLGGAVQPPHNIAQLQAQANAAQGPLAYLEQTTSNIGLPDGRR